MLLGCIAFLLTFYIVVAVNAMHQPVSILGLLTSFIMEEYNSIKIFCNISRKWIKSDWNFEPALTNDVCLASRIERD